MSSSGAFASRFVAAALAVSLVLVGAATVVLLAAFAFDTAALAHPGVLVDKGQDAADLLRLGALLDMASYLPFAVPVLFLHSRLRPINTDWMALLTAGGLAYVLIGAVGGALLASAGPPLIEGYATATVGGRDAARASLETVGQAAMVGLWGTLELIPFAIWIAGVGWLLRQQWRSFAALSIVIGVAAAASSIRTGFTGRTLADIDGPLAIAIAAPLGLFVVWQAWLAIRLWPVSTPLSPPGTRVHTVSQ